MGEPSSVSSFEQAAAAFLFFTFALSVAATFFALRAVQEIREKQVGGAMPLLRFCMSWKVVSGYDCLLAARLLGLLCRCMLSSKRVTPSNEKECR